MIITKSKPFPELLQSLEREKIVFLGNSARQGAKLALRDRKVAPRLQRLTERTKYIELSFIKEFSRRFITHMQFPADGQISRL